MKTAKLGAIFLISIMALAGVGAGYAAWTDTITIDGTVNTGNVDIVIGYLSGTEVWKDLGTDECVVIYYVWDADTGAVVWQSCDVPADGLLVAYAKAEKADDDAVTFTYNNLFPSIDFIADVALHYAGSIPVKVNKISWAVTSGNDWIDPLIESGDIMGIARKVTPVPPYVYDDVVEEGYQLHYCDWVGIALCIHLPQQDDLMSRSGSATATFEVVQWNEYPYTP